jgi:hypothetical protein
LEQGFAGFIAKNEVGPTFVMPSAAATSPLRLLIAIPVDSFDALSVRCADDGSCRHSFRLDKYYDLPISPGALGSLEAASATKRANQHMSSSVWLSKAEILAVQKTCASRVAPFCNCALGWTCQADTRSFDCSLAIVEKEIDDPSLV